MKVVELNFRGKYEDAVEYIYKNIKIEEPTEFKFTRIIETNAKMRKRAEFKNIYKYEVEGSLKLNDNNHAKNLYNKVFYSNFGTKYEDFERLGID